MKRLATHTLGCRLNQFETEKIAEKLGRFRFQRAPFEERADIYLINTCTVTHKADATCRQIISNVARRKGDAKLVVVGCYVESDRETVAALEGVDLVIDNKNKSRTDIILRNKWPEMFEQGTDVACENGGVSEFFGRSRAWLKISDGCNQSCAFCIIPTVRGSLRNNSAENVVRDVGRLVNAGYCEVTLTGVHIGHFKDKRAKVGSLCDLLKLLLDKTNVSRLRISSLEPQVVDKELIRFMAENQNRICRYLHLPLQSGSNRILGAMRRPYNRERYLEVTALARSEIPQVVIGADVIVGFPGETEDDFLATDSLVREVQFDNAFTFKYSVRDGTPAVKIREHVPDELAGERLERLIGTVREVARRKNANLVGSTHEVLVEKEARRGGLLQSRTRANKIVLIEGSAETIGSYRLVRLTGTTGSTFTGVPVAGRELAVLVE
ncbi:MAG: tRNA (N(6)-L-threonylcarbamoyladenosine(37)-C(2))-methylthiotransferase MtaB [candidate division Zixibacteria bacterium]|nr:tRNA (N(6)-L-threonylcarbamoyladenosine(37)-C(2))-methylthiotransferase MtaB [candidate division Zixibacteria bacterium]